MRHETTLITAADGTKLSAERWLPDGTPRAVVHVIHGMAEHAARYARLAEVLTGRGWAVWAADHRGHGRTAGSPLNAGHFADVDGWETVLRDQRTVLDAERAAHPGVPLVVLGHSLGSIIARDIAIRWGRDLTALVLSGAPGDPGALGTVGLTLAKREAAKGAASPSQRLNDLSFGGYNKPFRPNRTDFDWLSRDTSEVDAYAADPMCGFVCSAGFFRDMLTGLGRATDAKLLARIPTTLSVLVEAGGADPVAKNGRDTRAIARALARAGLSDVTCVVYEGARHEIFNETNREEVMALTADWLSARLAR